MDEHFVAGEQSSGLARSVIEQEDIEAMRNNWLTDTCIREVIVRHGNFKTSRVNIVDPTWLNEWHQLGCHTTLDTPPFFKPNSGVAFVQGLAIPSNEGNNHWTAIYVDLEHCGAIYFNTISSLVREHHAREMMRRFYTAFGSFFHGKGMNQFQFVVDQQTPDQGDGESCGIYVAAAVVDLLSSARPRTERLTREQIRIFRENGLKWLEDSPKVWDWLNLETSPKPKVKKGVHWDPSVL